MSEPKVSEAAVELSGAGKRYWKVEEQPLLLRSLLPFLRPPREEFWALRGVDLRLEQGETLGVIGRNGAGKTTLLRMLAGVTRPTEGSVTVVGRIAPLISVGVGFHREMTGRENVFLNAMLLGLRREQVEQRFDEIVDFAELESFIDTPVKFYSSGMFMRLGFAVAVHTDPQVMLVDEVLAVGDLAFQMKCIGRMQAIQRSGTTIVLVSHSMHAIRALCPRTVVMRHGAVAFDGETEQAIARHHELLTTERPTADAGLHDQSFVGGVIVEDRVLVDDADQPVHYVDPGATVRLKARVRFEEAVDSPYVHVTVLSESGAMAYGLQSALGLEYRRYEPGEVAEVVVSLHCRLGGGTYRVCATLATFDGRGILASDPLGPMFYVAPEPLAFGIADLSGTIAVDGIDLMKVPDIRLG